MSCESILPFRLYYLTQQSSFSFLILSIEIDTYRTLINEIDQKQQSQRIWP